jgi:predicted nucleic acid-binding protein
VILYLDTSALVKRYFLESYSNDIIALWRSADRIITSSVAYAETMASVYCKKKESNLSDKVVHTIVEDFKKDWHGFIHVMVMDDLNDMIDLIVQNHPLRGFDSIHLASALIIHDRFPEDFLFACFDQRLNLAAQHEGLEIMHS